MSSIRPDGYDWLAAKPTPFRLDETDQGKPFTLDETAEGRIGLFEQGLNKISRPAVKAGAMVSDIATGMWGGTDPTGLPMGGEQAMRSALEGVGAASSPYEEAKQREAAMRQGVDEAFPVPQAQTPAEYAVQGVTGALGEAALIAGGGNSIPAWAAAGAISGGEEGAIESAKMGTALKILHRLPLPLPARLAVESSGMFAYTYAQSGDLTESIVNGLLPAVLSGPDIYKATRNKLRADVEAAKGDPQKIVEAVEEARAAVKPEDAPNVVSPEAAARFVKDNPEEALAIADLESAPGRQAFQRAGFTGKLNGHQRRMFWKMVQAEVDKTRSPQQATEQRTQQAVDQLNTEAPPAAPDVAEVNRINDLAAQPDAITTTTEIPNEGQKETQGRPEGLLTDTTQGVTPPAVPPTGPQAATAEPMTWTEIKARAKELGVPIKGNRATVEAAVKAAEAAAFALKSASAEKPAREVSMAQAERDILDVYNRYEGLIGQREEYMPDEAMGGESSRRSSYSFRDTPLNRQHAKEIKDRLPPHLQMEIRLIKTGGKGYSSANAADIFGLIGPDAMAEAVKSFAESGKSGTIRRTLEWIAKNPEQVAPEDFYAAKRYQAMRDKETRAEAAKRTPETINPDTLEVGQKFEIGTEPHTVKDVDPDTGTVTVEDGITFEVPPGKPLIVDKGTLTKPQGDTGFDFGQPETTKTTNLFGERTFEPATGEQRTMEFGSDTQGNQPTQQGWKTPEGMIRPEMDAGAEARIRAENAANQQLPLSPAEEAQRLADRGKDALGIVWKPGRATIRDDTVPGAIQVPDAAVEARIQSSHGQQGQSWWQKTWDALKTLPQKTRAQEFLPNTPENATFNEFFRLTKAIPSAAVDEVTRTIGAIMDPLGSHNQQLLFERKVHIQNQLASLDRGEPLRHEWKNRAQVEAYNQQLDALIAKTPSVQKALDTRRKIVVDLAKRLEAAKLISKEAAANAETYFHQQVLMQAELDRISAGGTSARPTVRPFQKKRFKDKDVESLPAEFDYNTKYIESESRYMFHAEMELRKKQLYDRMIAPADRYQQFEKLAEASGVSVNRVARQQNYELWQPRPGNEFFPATSIPERIAEQVELGILQAGDLTPDMLRTVLALGGRKQTLALPRRLVQQLEASKKTAPEKGIAKLASETMRLWKGLMLFIPTRITGYQLRNTTGDMDPVLASAPGILKRAGSATADLHKYYLRNDTSVPGDLKKWRDLGVIDSSFAAEEIPSLKDVPVLRRFYAADGGVAKLPAKLVDRYYETATKFTKFREAILRVSAARYYREALANGTLKHYGASRKAVIEKLAKEQGVDVAAAKMARELLGDYGNVSVMGQYLRKKVIPFYSWMEVNFKRYPRMAVNAFEYGKEKGNTVAGKAAFATLAGLGIGAMSAVMYTYNRLMHPEAENELGVDDRNSPHLTLGKADDGTIILLRNTGALGDFTEWFGLNTLVNLYPKYRDGQITLGEIATEMAKAPLNKVVSGLRPDVKSTFEIATGKSLYPDFTQPRSMARDELAAGVVGMKDEYRAAKGLVTQDGTRARPHYLQRLIGASDAKQNALQEIYDLRDTFLRQQGKAVIDRGGGAGSTAFTNMRRAAEANDMGAFKEAKAAYLAEGKKAKNFGDSLKRLDPIASRLDDRAERLFQYKFLTGEQRTKLKIAREHAADVRKKMARMWYQSR